MYFAIFKRKGLLVAVSLIISVVLICFLCAGSATVFSFAKKKLPIYRVDTPEKKIAISFDCAWGVDYTDKLLSIMSEEDILCTFFMVEFWTNKHKDYVKKISEFGHEIGTHSSTHPYMSKLENTAIEKELSSSIKAIEDITGKKVTLFRAPYGDYDDLLLTTASQMGLYTIQWDVDSLDWKNLSASQIESRVTSKVKNGSIVLFHNQGLHTADALKSIIRKLKGEGYSFVPIGELIYKNNYYIANDGSQISNL